MRVQYSDRPATLDLRNIRRILHEKAPALQGVFPLLSGSASWHLRWQRGVRKGAPALVSGESRRAERSWASFAWRFGGIAGRFFAGWARGFVCGGRERHRHGARGLRIREDQVRALPDGFVARGDQPAFVPDDGVVEPVVHGVENRKSMRDRVENPGGERAPEKENGLCQTQVFRRLADNGVNPRLAENVIPPVPSLEEGAEDLAGGHIQDAALVRHGFREPEVPAAQDQPSTLDRPAPPS